MKFIKEAIEGVGEYDHVEYSLSDDKKVLSYFIFDMDSLYSKTIAERMNEKILKLHEYDIFNIDMVDITFVEIPSKAYQITIKNYEENGNRHDRFDVVKVGSKLEKYNFDIHLPDGKYLTGFDILEIGTGYNLEDIKWISFHFRDLKKIVCYLEKDDYINFCDFYTELVPECEIIRCIVK